MSRKFLMVTRLLRYAISCIARNDVLIAAALVAGLVLPAVADARGVTVICESEGECRHEPDEALFDISNFAPGEGVLRTLEIRNERAEACDLSLGVERTNDEENIAEQLDVEIADGDDWYFDGTFDDLLAEEPVELGTLGAGDTNTINWAVNFNEDAGNEYQGRRVEFDVDVNVTCAEAEEELAGGGVAGAFINAKTPRVLGESVKAVLERFPVTGAGALNPARLGWGIIAITAGGLLLINQRRLSSRRG